MHGLTRGQKYEHVSARVENINRVNRASAAIIVIIFGSNYSDFKMFKSSNAQCPASTMSTQCYVHAHTTWARRISVRPLKYNDKEEKSYNKAETIHASRD